MLMAAKNQIKVFFLTMKYALMREMLNKTTFLANVIFMVLNNATFIIQWIILFSLKDDVGGYNMRLVMLLWGMAASTYGISRFFFYKAFSLSDVITDGKLDSYLVQPKNVLISCITSDISTSALGDIVYGYIMLAIYGITIQNLIMFTLLSICGGLILVAFSVILSSLSFWFTRSDAVAEVGNSMITYLATYPDGIFKGIIKFIIYTIVPVGISNYIPIQVIAEFEFNKCLIVIAMTTL